MNFNADSNPSVTALYLVDRGMQGKYYRWYDAETDQWGACGADMNEAIERKESTVVGFYPWVGPLTGKNFKPTTPVHVVTEDAPKTKKVAKKMARQSGAKLVISQVGNTKVGSIVKGNKTTHPDGTVFFREDRQKWVAMWNGKQEAARPTPEACLAFLLKKYNHTGIVLPKSE